MLNEALAETRSILSADDSKEEDHWPSPRRGDFLFHSTRARYFCGEGRSNSPFGQFFIMTLLSNSLSVSRFSSSAVHFTRGGGYTAQHNGGRNITLSQGSFSPAPSRPLTSYSHPHKS